MAHAVIQRKNNSSSGTVGSLATGNFASSPTAGNLIAVLIQFQTTTITSVTDTLGNTYTPTASSPLTDASAPNKQAIYYAKNCLGGGANSVTVTFAGTSSYTTITAYESSGADTAAPFVTDATGTASASGDNEIDSATLSLTGLNCIVFEVFESDSTGNANLTPTPYASYTQAQADASKYVWDGYRLNVTADHAAGATATTALAFGIIAAAFKEAGAPSGGDLLLLVARDMANIADMKDMRG
jgi:hypothetical protein